VSTVLPQKSSSTPVQRFIAVAVASIQVCLGWQFRQCAAAFLAKIYFGGKPVFLPLSETAQFLGRRRTVDLDF
jgi:hypothetical protein